MIDNKKLEIIEYPIKKIHESDLNGEIKKNNGLPGELLYSEKKKIGIYDKTKPHSYFDLMLLSYKNPKNILNNNNDSSLSELLKISFKIIKTSKALSDEFNFFPDSGRIIYNFSDYFEPTSAMSMENFHIHICFISEKEKLSNILIVKESLSVNDFFNFLLFKKISLKFPELDVRLNNLIIDDSKPIGIIINTQKSTDNINFNYLSKILKEIHKVFVNLCDLFDKNFISLNKKTQYSVSIFQKNDEIQILLTGKKNSKNGGGTETFIPNHSPILLVNRLESYFMNGELNDRTRFQNKVVEKFKK